MENSLASWGNFFIAESGAAAALTGLLFLAISINVQRILSVAGLPERSGESIVFFSSLVFVGLLGLIPGQPLSLFGLEVVVIYLLIEIFTLRGQRRAWRGKTMQQNWLVNRMVMGQMAILPSLVAGLMLMTQCGSALPVLAVGMLASMVIGMFNCWILLIEINR